jgi:hypothetical protein
MVDEALKDLSARFDEIYNEEGRKSILGTRAPAVERQLRPSTVADLWQSSSARYNLRNSGPKVTHRRNAPGIHCFEISSRARKTF